MKKSLISLGINYKAHPNLLIERETKDQLGQRQEGQLSLGLVMEALEQTCNFMMVFESERKDYVSSKITMMLYDLNTIIAKIESQNRNESKN